MTGDSKDVILTALAVIGLIWYNTVLSIGLLGCWTARRRYQLRPRSRLTSTSSAPGVSILRPLKGLDANLYENLESTFTQEYPNYEIIFSVADEDDQALSVVRDLISKYPRVPTTVIVGDEVVGVNPKVNNLIRPFRHAANDILWVLDSNIMVQSGTLARSVDALINCEKESSPSRRVALVHHVPFAFASEHRLGSKIEEVFLNTNHAKMYIAINALALDSCVVGKSNLYRRSDINLLTGSLQPQCTKLGKTGLEGSCGLLAFGRFLAEDNMIASALWHELGLCHDLSRDIAYNTVGSMSLSDYAWRRIRWIRVRKHMILAATVLEPFTEAVVLSVIACLSSKFLFGLPLWITLIVHFTMWILVDMDVYTSLAGQPLPVSAYLQFFGFWSARELLAFPIYIVAVFGSQVIWRGSRYQLLRNGEVVRAPNTTVNT